MAQGLGTCYTKARTAWMAAVGCPVFTLLSGLAGLRAANSPHGQDFFPETPGVAWASAADLRLPPKNQQAAGPAELAAIGSQQSKIRAESKQGEQQRCSSSTRTKCSLQKQPAPEGTPGDPVSRKCQSRETSPVRPSLEVLRVKKHEGTSDSW